MLVGDSTVRYLYLTLLQLLQPPSGVRSWGGCKRRCFWNDKSWPTPKNRAAYEGNRTAYALHWRSFFDDTTSDASGQAMCDCFRDWPCDAGMPNCERGWENRYAVLNWCGGARLTFIQYRGKPGELVHGERWPNGVKPNGVRPAKAKVDAKVDFNPWWSLPLGHVSRKLSKLHPKPSMVVGNIGHHLGPKERFVRSRRRPTGLNESSLLPMYAALAQDLRLTGAPRLVWMGTVQWAGDQGPNSKDEQALAARVFPEVLDTARLTAPMDQTRFWDGSTHLDLAGNVELGLALLQLLSPGSSQDDALRRRAAVLVQRPVWSSS